MFVKSLSHVKHTSVINTFIKCYKSTANQGFHLTNPIFASSQQIPSVEGIYLLCAGNIPDADAWAATCWEATRAAEVKPNEGKKHRVAMARGKIKSRHRPNGEPAAAICPFLNMKFSYSKDRLQTIWSSQYLSRYWPLCGFLNSYSKRVRHSISLARHGAKWFACIPEQGAGEIIDAS